MEDFSPDRECWRAALVRSDAHYEQYCQAQTQRYLARPALLRWLEGRLWRVRAYDRAALATTVRNALVDAMGCVIDIRAHTPTPLWWAFLPVLFCLHLVYHPLHERQIAQALPEIPF